MGKHMIWRMNGCVIKLYNFIMATHFINRNNRFCRRIREILFHNICHKCHASFGNKNKDRLFYVIRCPHEKLGVFGLFNYVVYHLRLSESYHAEPIVDWQHYPNAGITEDETAGRVNAWEWFFDSMVEGKELSEVYRSKHVIMSGGEIDGGLSEIRNPEQLLENSQLIHKYIRLNKEMKEKLELFMEQSGMKGSRTLGVLGRGTDFRETKPKWHAICATPQQLCEKIDEKESEWGKFDKIFLATEDQQIMDALKEKYDDRLIFNQTSYVTSTGGVWLNKLYDTDEYKGKKQQKSSEYVEAIYLLTKCDALIASVVGGTLGAMRIRGGYDQCYFFDLGSYQ